MNLRFFLFWPQSIKTNIHTKCIYSHAIAGVRDPHCCNLAFGVVLASALFVQCFEYCNDVYDVYDGDGCRFCLFCF